MNCQEIRENLSAYLDGEIPPTGEGVTSERIAGHLESCAACASECESLERTIDLVQGLRDGWQAVDMSQEIREAVRRARVADSAGSAVADPGRVRRFLTRSGARWTVGALAAGLLVGVSFWIRTSTQQDLPGSGKTGGDVARVDDHEKRTAEDELSKRTAVGPSTHVDSFVRLFTPESRSTPLVEEGARMKSLAAAEDERLGERGGIVLDNEAPPADPASVDAPASKADLGEYARRVEELGELQRALAYDLARSHDKLALLDGTSRDPKDKGRGEWKKAGLAEGEAETSKEAAGSDGDLSQDESFGPDPSRKSEVEHDRDLRDRPRPDPDPAKDPATGGRAAGQGGASGGQAPPSEQGASMPSLGGEGRQEDLDRTRADRPADGDEKAGTASGAIAETDSGEKSGEEEGKDGAGELRRGLGRQAPSHGGFRNLEGWSVWRDFIERSRETPDGAAQTGKAVEEDLPPPGPAEAPDVIAHEPVTKILPELVIRIRSPSRLEDSDQVFQLLSGKRIQVDGRDERRWTMVVALDAPEARDLVASLETAFAGRIDRILGDPSTAEGVENAAKIRESLPERTPPAAGTQSQAPAAEPGSGASPLAPPEGRFGLFAETSEAASWRVTIELVAPE